MRKLAIALASMIGCTALMAMPTEQEMERVMPVIEELSRAASAALKTGKMTRGQFAEMMLGYLPDADTEAAKVVLIRQAFRQLMLAGSTEKAVEAYALLDTHVADVPGGTFGEWCSPFIATLAKADKANDLAILLEHAFGSVDVDSAITLYKQTQPTLRRLAASKNGGARLAAVAGRCAGLERRKGELRNLRAALQRSPDNISLRGKLGLCLAAMGDWKAALTEFAQTGGQLAEVAVWENTRPADSPLTAADVANFWWEKAGAMKDAEVAAVLRGHAAGWYQEAINGGELPGLKKTLAEKRLAEVAKIGEVAAVDMSSASPGKPTKPLPRTGKSTPKGWTDDFEAAQKAAEESGKPMFIFFDGSTYMRCRDQTIMAEPAFVKEAGSRYILVYLDNSRDKSLVPSNQDDQLRRAQALLRTDSGVPQFHVFFPNGDRHFQCNRRDILSSVKDWLDYLGKIADALSYIHSAQKKIGDRDKNSDGAVKIMHDALVKIDGEVLGRYFVEDAQTVIENNGAYLQDFPFLEFVYPLRKEYEEYVSEIGSAAWKLHKESGQDYNYEKLKQLEKEVFVKEKYGDKFNDLLARLNVAKGRISRHPQTIHSLQRLESEIKESRARYTK